MKTIKKTYRAWSIIFLACFLIVFAFPVSAGTTVLSQNVGANAPASMHSGQWLAIPFQYNGTDGAKLEYINVSITEQDSKSPTYPWIVEVWETSGGSPTSLFSDYSIGSDEVLDGVSQSTYNPKVVNYTANSSRSGLTYGTTYAIILRSPTSSADRFMVQHIEVTGDGLEGYYSTDSGSSWILYTNAYFYLEVIEAGADVPGVTLTSPDDTSVINENQNFSFDVGGSNADNCSLYGDWTGVWAKNETKTGTVVGSYTFEDVAVAQNEGTYLWNVVCYLDGTGYWALNNRSFTVDLTEPSIVLNSTYSDFTTSNLSKQGANPYNDTMVYAFNLWDSREVYAYSVNITKDGISYYYDNDSALGVESYFLTDTINISSWGNGYYEIIVRASDSHTKNKIKDYEVKKQKSKLEFKTTEGNTIWIESEEPANTDATKSLDRYSFEFDFDDDSEKKRTFIVRSDKKIVYRENSEYKGHFVVSDGVDGNWIDFEGVPGKPKIQKISDYYYKVTFDKIKSNIKFNSVGGLNVNEVRYTFYRGEYFVSAPRGVYTGSTGITLTVTGIENLISSGITGNLTYNKTFMGYDSVDVVTQTCTGDCPYGDSFNATITKIVTHNESAGEYPFNWSVLVPQPDGTYIEFETPTEIQSVIDWLLDDCSVATTTALFFQIFNEQEPLELMEQMQQSEILASYWAASPDNSKNFTKLWTTENNLTMCLSNDQIYADIYLKYTTDGGFTHRYFLYNQSLTNSSIVGYDIYNFNTTTGVSQLRITSRYQTGYSYYPNAIVSLERLYPSDNQWRTVQMGKTDDYGFVGFNILERSTDYRLVYRDTNNNLLKITDTLTFACDNSVCTIIALLDPYDETLSANNISVNYNFNNNTRILTVSYVNGAAADVSIAVEQTTAVRTNTLFSDHDSAQLSQTHTYNLTGYTGTIYVKVNATSNGDSLLDFSTYIDLGRPTLDGFVGDSEGAFLGFLVMIVIVMFGIWSPVAVIVSALFGLVSIWLFGLVSAINLTFIIVATVIGIVLGLKLKQ